MIRREVIDLIYSQKLSKSSCLLSLQITHPNLMKNVDCSSEKYLNPKLETKLGHMQTGPQRSLQSLCINQSSKPQHRIQVFFYVHLVILRTSQICNAQAVNIYNLFHVPKVSYTESTDIIFTLRIPGFPLYQYSLNRERMGLNRK